MLSSIHFLVSLSYFCLLFFASAESLEAVARKCLEQKPGTCDEFNGEFNFSQHEIEEGKKKEEDVSNSSSGNDPGNSSSSSSIQSCGSGQQGNKPKKEGVKKRKWKCLEGDEEAETDEDEGEGLVRNGRSTLIVCPLRYLCAVSVCNTD